MAGMASQLSVNRIWYLWRETLLETRHINTNKMSSRHDVMAGMTSQLTVNRMWYLWIETLLATRHINTNKMSIYKMT